MSEYYGIATTPMDDYLAHYGVRGMKWGVRRAIASGNDKKLSRQYAKAQKKLAKLNDNADIEKQRSNSKKYGKIAKVSGLIGAGGAGLYFGASKLQKKNWNDFHNNITDLYNAVHNPDYAKPGAGRISLTRKDIENFVSGEPYVTNLYNKRLKAHNVLKGAKYVGAGVGAAGLATSAITGVKAGIAKHRTTSSGHAAAVARRNEFQREMNKAFAGTKYASGGKKRRRK